MKQSELFIMLAAAERDCAAMSRSKPHISTQQRADARFVEAVCSARAALFMGLVDLALQKEELEERLHIDERIQLSSRDIQRLIYQQELPAADPDPGAKPKRPWPTCRHCGEDLILAHVDRGFCNAECEAKARFSQ